MVKNLPASAGNVSSIPGSGRFPEDEMATHSSVLAWRIPRTEEPGGLQSTGSQRATKQQQPVVCSGSVPFQRHGPEFDPQFGN